MRHSIQATRTARGTKRPAARGAKARGRSGGPVAPFFLGMLVGVVATLGIVYLRPERAAPVEVGAEPEAPEAFDFKFRQRLPDSSVPTDTEHYGDEPIAAQSHEYRLQAASFQDRAHADSLRAELLLDGHRATIEPSGGGEYHVVMVGPFESKVLANRAMTALRGRNLSPILLSRPIDE